MRTTRPPRAGALALRAAADVAAAGALRAHRSPLGTPRLKARGAILRPLPAQATLGLGKVRFGSELLSHWKAGVCTDLFLP